MRLTAVAVLCKWGFCSQVKDGGGGAIFGISMLSSVPVGVVCFLHLVMFTQSGISLFCGWRLLTLHLLLFFLSFFVTLVLVRPDSLFGHIGLARRHVRLVHNARSLSITTVSCGGEK